MVLECESLAKMFIRNRLACVVWQMSTGDFTELLSLDRNAYLAACREVGRVPMKIKSLMPHVMVLTGHKVWYTRFRTDISEFHTIKSEDGGWSREGAMFKKMHKVVHTRHEFLFKASDFIFKFSVYVANLSPEEAKQIVLGEVARIVNPMYIK